jgi:hypothetical protein
MLRSFLVFKIFLLVVLSTQLFATEISGQKAIPSGKVADKVADVVNSGNSGKNDFFDYTHTFYREKNITDKNGQTKIEREYVKQTLVGEELLAVVNYTYRKDDAIKEKEIVFDLPVPKEVFYVENSVKDEKYVWFSVDNGKNWSRFSDLRMTESDGTKRIAQGKDVTHLQWRMQKTLKKGDVGTLEYKIIIR